MAIIQNLMRLPDFTSPVFYCFAVMASVIGFFLGQHGAKTQNWKPLFYFYFVECLLSASLMIAGIY